MNTWSDRQRCRSHRVTATVGVINGEQIQPGAAISTCHGKNRKHMAKKTPNTVRGVIKRLDQRKNTETTVDTATC